MLTLDDFDYHLPEHLIAQNPPQERGQSRLLVVQSAQDGNTPVDKAQESNAATPILSDQRFVNLPQLLHPNDLLVFNNTKVIHARLFATKATGGRVEIMVERVLDDRTAVAMLRASHTPKPGATLQLADVAEVAVLQRSDMMFTLEFKSLRADLPTALDIIEYCGQLPLPPYITDTPTAEDEARYQTVYAKEPGAVAAPTAGLHFTDPLLKQLDEAGIGRAEITLHVGAGTFQPVKVQDISQHTMHRERYFIEPSAVAALEQARARGGRIIAVGTTSLRALESWAWSEDAVRGDTDIFITPGYEFKVVDALITNFHLPKSTLLMLVSALAGMETIRTAYAHAVEREYRFFSYGDAMWLERKPLKSSA
jgi:S-adenosylmethionine:tRNA ribosyltransferase-isomerase